VTAGKKGLFLGEMPQNWGIWRTGFIIMEKYFSQTASFKQVQ
jgi:hypothetical protein